MKRPAMIAAIAAAAAILVVLGAVAGVLIASSLDDDDEESTSVADARGYLGVGVTLLPAQAILRITSVEKDGPAALAGVLVNDVLRAVDDQSVRTPEQLRSIIESKKPGTKVSLTIERDGRDLKLSATLTAAPAAVQQPLTPASPGQNQPGRERGRLGLQVAPITPQLKERFNLQRDSGIVVLEVSAEGLGGLSGLKQGDIILRIDGRDVGTDVLALQRLLAQPRSNQELEIQVLRGSEALTLKVNLPANEIMPQTLRELLQRQFEEGRLSPERLREALGQYADHADNVVIGVITSVNETSLTLTPYGGGNERSIAITQRTAIRRVQTVLRATDLKVGELVLVLSLDGGKTAISITAFGPV